MVLKGYSPLFQLLCKFRDVQRYHLAWMQTRHFSLNWLHCRDMTAWFGLWQRGGWKWNVLDFSCHLQSSPVRSHFLSAPCRPPVGQNSDWINYVHYRKGFTPLEGHALHFYAAERRISVKGFTLGSPKFTAVLLAPAYVSSISFSLVRCTAL